jgi:hypothetical protein
VDTERERQQRPLDTDVEFLSGREIPEPEQMMDGRIAHTATCALLIPTRNLAACHSGRQAGMTVPSSAAD